MIFPDRPARTLFLTELLSGLWLTLCYFYRPKVTLDYPHEKGPLLSGAVEIAHWRKMRIRVGSLPSSLRRQHELMRGGGDLLK